MAGGVRFYQAQSFYKEPGDTGSLWHSDSYACPLDTNNQLTTAWVPMVEVEREMGVLAFARGSHQDMNLNFWNDGNAMAHTDDAQAATGELGVYAAKHVKSRYHVDVWPRLKPGDVTFHGGWTLHASFKVRRHLCTHAAQTCLTVAGWLQNSAEKTREAVAVSYVPDSVRTLPTRQFEPLYAADDLLNGVRQKLKAEDVPPMSGVPTSVLPRVWPAA